MKLYYYNFEENFGDMLSPIVLEWISKEKVEWVHQNTCGKVLAIGSIMSALRENDVVWGSGIMHNKPFTTPEKVKFLAVRGPLTKNLIGDQCPEVYGDPALLMPLIYNPPIVKKYEVGIIPHYVDKMRFRITDPNYLTINVLNSNPLEIIDQMLSCKMIMSTSLHGIIVAEAYGIPAVWLKVGNKIIGNCFKFHDYFAATNRFDIRPIEIKKIVSNDNIVRAKAYTLPQPYINVEPLIKAWREYQNDSNSE